ncbi:MAG: GTP pyrophosphokinase family protein [Clostridia bacterium]
MLKDLIFENTDDILSYLTNFSDLMMQYNSAIREIKTKLEILNDELSLRSMQSPISSIQSRLKKPISILEKLKRMHKEINVKSIVDNLNDVAGIRIICPFIDDIYKVSEMLLKQDDITLIKIKDYIKNPKPNGYRSYHIIVEVPVFFSNRKKPMRVEIQIRTVAMDFWASLEHELEYKSNCEESESIVAELKECADTIADTDIRMLNIRDRIKKSRELDFK